MNAVLQFEACGVPSPALAVEPLALPPTPDGGELSPRSSRSRQIALAPGFTPEAGASPFPGYRLIRLRGRGGFATVWEATGPDGLTALKFMSSHNASSTIRELRALRAFTKLEHPNLLPITQVWSIPGQIVIGMKLADASMLDLMLLYADEFNRPIEPPRLLRYIGEAAKALDFLNARRHSWDGRTVGFQHGDIKPNNILLVGDTAMLADYGLATPTTGPKTPCHRHGTVEYVAPEVIQGYATETSDQFSLAVTYYVLRASRFPYPPPPPIHEMSRSFLRPPPDLSAISGAEQVAVAQALSPIPSARFPNCTAFVNALRKALNVPAPSA